MKLPRLISEAWERAMDCYLSVHLTTHVLIAYALALIALGLLGLRLFFRNAGAW